MGFEAHTQAHPGVQYRIPYKACTSTTSAVNRRKYSPAHRLACFALLPATALPVNCTSSSRMNARSAKNQLASNSCLQIPKYRVQSPVRPRPSPKQQQQVQQVQQQQLLQAVMMAEPVLQANAFISQPNRPAISQPSGAAPQHRLHMTVNSSDVDMYGVVTNTKYHDYMYAARAALGASAGLSMEVLLGQYGIMMATTSYNITFKSPLQYGDHFYAESVPCEVRGATFKFKERVVRVSCSGQEQVVAEGVATCVALVPANPPVKPARIPAPMKEALLRCIAAQAGAATAN